MFVDLQQSSGLLLVGLFLPVITACSAMHTMESRATVAAAEPWILEQPVALNRTVDGCVTKIQFFEREHSKGAFMADRKYETRFATKATKTIYTEISLDYPRSETNIYFPIALYFRQNGRTLRIEELESELFRIGLRLAM